MLILGIETSCDDTSVAVVNASDDGIQVLSNIVSSQIDTHTPYGGVVPILAAREHEKNLPAVLDSALKASGCNLEAIDLIAVTSGPGLIMSLVKGVNFAKELAQKSGKPLIGINHMEGHIASCWLPTTENSKHEYRNPKPEFPVLCLTVSGGHTELVLMKEHCQYELIGRTVDDASGEAFDKIARLIGLEYPGGPAISREAEKFKPQDLSSKITLPRPMLHSKDFNFSFSGLKTAVYYLVRDLKKSGELTHDQVTQIAHEAQDAIVDVLIAKTKKAIELYQPQSVLLAGGVSANKLLRNKLQLTCDLLHVNCHLPHMQYTTDNAAMIACAAYFRTKNEQRMTNNDSVEADANWEIAY